MLKRRENIQPKIGDICGQVNNPSREMRDSVFFKKQSVHYLNQWAVATGGSNNFK